MQCSSTVEKLTQLDAPSINYLNSTQHPHSVLNSPRAKTFVVMGRHKSVVCKTCYRVMRSDNLKNHMKRHDKHVKYVDPLPSTASSYIRSWTTSKNNVKWPIFNSQPRTNKSTLDIFPPISIFSLYSLSNLSIFFNNSSSSKDVDCKRDHYLHPLEV